jgi:excisionase family DNA binding protein
MGSQQNTSSQEYLTVPQAARFLGRCDRTVRTYIKSGVLRAHRVKGRGQALWVRGDDIRSLKELRKNGMSISTSWISSCESMAWTSASCVTNRSLH